jgi:hypothetical protein
MMPKSPPQGLAMCRGTQSLLVQNMLATMCIIGSSDWLVTMQ